MFNNVRLKINNYVHKSRFGFICILLFCITIQKSYACTLNMAVSSNFPPYHVMKSDGGWGGVSVELARALVEKAGCDLIITSIPWGRAITLLSQGKVQLVSNFTMNAERATFTEFLGPHHIEKVAFIAKSTLSQNITDVRQLSQFNGVIAITRGNEFGDEFDKLVRSNPQVNINLISIRSNIDRYSLLLRGRIDAMFDDEHSAKYLLFNANKEGERFNIPFVLNGNPVYFGFSQVSVSTELRVKLNSSWLELLSGNVITKIYEKYGLQFDKQELYHYKKQLLSTRD